MNRENKNHNEPFTSLQIAKITTSKGDLLVGVILGRNLAALSLKTALSAAKRILELVEEIVVEREAAKKSNAENEEESAS